MWTGILILLLAFVALAFYLDPKRRAPGNLPPVYAPIPIIGCFHQFAVAPLTALKNAHKKLGDCFTLQVMGFNMTVLVGPEAQATFFQASDEELSPKEAYRFVVPVFGKGVVYDSSTAMLYEQLKFVKSGLALNQLKKNVPMMEAEALEFFKSWGKSGEVDLLEQMNSLTILTASRCLLGPEIRNDPTVQKKFAVLYHDLEGGLNPLAFLFPYAPIPAHFKRDRARVEVQKLFAKIVQQRRETADPDDLPTDMLQVLMDAEYKNGEILDDNGITGILLALLFAGQHTSGITATWTTFFLTANPKIKQEIMEEQDKIRKEFGEAITFDSLKASVKLEAAVRETLRMYPPLIMLMRKIMKPLRYKGMDLPVGDFLVISPGYAMGLPETFPEPEKWKPERFLTGEKLPEYSFIAFGGGKHGCPGENFGIMQVKTITTTLLRNFDFEIPKGIMPVPDYTTMVVGPKQPAQIFYTRK